MLLAEGLGWRGMTRPWSADCQNGRKERPLGSPTDYAAAFMPNREKPWRKSRMLSRLSKNSCAEHYWVVTPFPSSLFGPAISDVPFPVSIELNVCVSSKDISDEAQIFFNLSFG